MVNNDEKVTAPESGETITLSPEQVAELREKGEVKVELPDADAGLVEGDVDVIKAENEKKVIAQHTLNPQQEDLFKQIMEEAKMPVKLSDGKFKLGENELDIRYLSKGNKEQMFFRELVLAIVYLKQILTSQIDTTRLLMIIADKLGIEDIVGKTDEVIEKIEKENKIRESLKSKGKTEEIKENA